MIWLIIPIVFIVAWIWFGIQEEDIVGGFLIGLLTALLAAILCFGTCAVIECSSDVEYEIAESKEISALVDNARFSHSVSGCVFLIQTRTDTTLKSIPSPESSSATTKDNVTSKPLLIIVPDNFLASLII